MGTKKTRIQMLERAESILDQLCAGVSGKTNVPIADHVAIANAYIALACAMKKEEE